MASHRGDSGPKRFLPKQDLSDIYDDDLLADSDIHAGILLIITHERYIASFIHNIL